MKFRAYGSRYIRFNCASGAGHTGQFEWNGKSRKLQLNRDRDRGSNRSSVTKSVTDTGNAARSLESTKTTAAAPNIFKYIFTISLIIDNAMEESSDQNQIKIFSPQKRKKMKKNEVRKRQEVKKKKKKMQQWKGTSSYLSTYLLLLFTGRFIALGTFGTFHGGFIATLLPPPYPPLWTIVFLCVT